LTKGDFAVVLGMWLSNVGVDSALPPGARLSNAGRGAPVVLGAFPLADGAETTLQLGICLGTVGGGTELLLGM
jgi:hypothetical protein